MKSIQPTVTMTYHAAEVKRLELCTARIATLEAALRKYGDHRWKCSISRMIRNPEVSTGLEVCDCGWQEFVAALTSPAPAPAVSDNVPPRPWKVEMVNNALKNADIKDATHLAVIQDVDLATAAFIVSLVNAATAPAPAVPDNVPPPEPTEYERTTYAGRCISDRRELASGYCGSAPLETHVAQMRDPDSWVHSWKDEWFRVATETAAPAPAPAVDPEVVAEAVAALEAADEAMAVTSGTTTILGRSQFESARALVRAALARLRPATEVK